MTCFKRYEYWAYEDGKAVKKWTRWFKWSSSSSREKVELKGYKGDVLRCEYREEDEDGKT